MSHSLVGARAQRALCIVGAVAIALTLAVFASSKAEAAPTTASWYGPGFAGNPTASGEPFDPSAMTAAHKTLPFGTQVEVCYDSCTTVTINDRGPFANGAEYDLSQGAAEATGLINAGVGTVDATVLGQGGSAEPAAAPEPAPEPAAAPQQEAAPQAAAPQQSGSAAEVDVVEQSPGIFVANSTVPVGPEGYDAAYEQALELAQQRANAAAGLA